MAEVRQGQEANILQTFYKHFTNTGRQPTEQYILLYFRLREEEKKELNIRMTAAEQQSDVLIKELMVASQRYSDPAKAHKTD